MNRSYSRDGCRKGSLGRENGTGKGSEVWIRVMCAGSHSNNSAWIGTKKSRKGFQRHLGNEKGMLFDPGLPHSMLGKWKTDGKYAPKHGPSLVLGEAEENLVLVWGTHRAFTSNPWLWPTSFCDLHWKPRAGSLVHTLPLLHKGHSWMKPSAPSTNLGCHLGHA